jgi:hypothetical protein
MRRAKVYSQLTKRVLRAELTTRLTCGTRLRRYATLSERTVITLDGSIHVTHCGYRCPDSNCPTHPRSYRSAAADALALPGFTFGLDLVILVGHLRLAQQHTLDQAHQAIQARLTRFDLTLSRRETLYLFDTYCTLGHWSKVKDLQELSSRLTQLVRRAFSACVSEFPAFGPWPPNTPLDRLLPRDDRLV